MNYYNKFTQINYWEIDYDTFETIVKEVYGVKEYEFMADIEGSNDSTYTYSTDNDSFDEYEENEIKKFRENGECNYIASTLIVDMANNGFIPKGNIIIKISY